MSSIQANPSNDRGSRAFKPGSRWAFAGAVVVALVLAAVLVVALKPASNNKVLAVTPGKLPSWLPKSAQHPVANPTPQIEQATAANPILDEQQGYPVDATVPSGSVEMTAVGPQVPGYVSGYAEKGLWPATKLVPSVFYVSLANVKGSVPISAKAFSVLTGTGQVLPVKLSLQGGGKVPAVVKAGQRLTLEAKTKTLAGQGSIRWAPGGPKVLVGWVYQLELD